MLRFSCKNCHSSETYALLPGDPEYNLEMLQLLNGTLDDDMPVTMECRKCGYRWEIIVQGKPKEKGL